MTSSTEFISASVQLTALYCALFSIWGWFFWLGTLNSDVTLAELRVDPEFDSMIEIADMLAYLAIPALLFGLASLWWRPRYIAFSSIVLGIVGTCWLAFGV